MFIEVFMFGYLFGLLCFALLSFDDFVVLIDSVIW